MKNCQCYKWKENISLTLFPSIYLITHIGDYYKGYTGEVFKFCPWCGRALEEDDKCINLHEKIES